MQISKASSADAPQLFAVWEAAVRATHDFLNETDIQRLVPLVRELMSSYAPIYCLRDESGAPFAFLGAANGEIDMLFVAPGRRGGGAGRALAEFARSTLGARKVSVNEQNAQAVGFYAHLGFRTVGRSPLDGQGQPFPLLHMELA
ncbi:GNAT family N-acetyltransferase [Pseudoduganella sp.]|uniref:GNAT family N-acetyltransferase n=1 Tax=Pseudoduganella sp. TaxID=1880898 RepID=UPI0035B26B69